MTHMMDNPVTAMLVLVGLIVVLAALTVGLRVVGGLDGRQRPRAPEATAAPSLEEAPTLEAPQPRSLDQ